MADCDRWLLQRAQPGADAPGQNLVAFGEIAWRHEVPLLLPPLAVLCAIGLDYLTLGQSAPTLSGGEAQRVKLAAELARPHGGRTLYLLDEPTTGLHFADIQMLLKVLHDFVAAGNTVLVVEHNLDVIKTADWIIDLGPEGGAAGGRIVAEGTPEEVARNRESHTGVALANIFSAKTNGRLTRKTGRQRIVEEAKATKQAVAAH